MAPEEMGASGQNSNLLGSGGMTPEREVGKDETVLQRRGKTEVCNAHGDEQEVAEVDGSQRVDLRSDVASETQQPLSNPDGRGEAVKGHTEIEAVGTKDVFLSAAQKEGSGSKEGAGGGVEARSGQAGGSLEDGEESSLGSTDLKDVGDAALTGGEREVACAQGRGDGRGGDSSVTDEDEVDTDRDMRTAATVEGSWVTVGCHEEVPGDVPGCAGMMSHESEAQEKKGEWGGDGQ